MKNTQTTAAAIADRIRAIAPPEHTAETTAVLVALEAIDDDTDEGEAAGIFEWAGEHSTELTTDGCWDGAIDEAVEAWFGID